MLDEKLVKKSEKIISDRYSTENGKKFILHLISSFLSNGSSVQNITSRNSDGKQYSCCINKCTLVPMDLAVVSEGPVYFGLVSNKSDKALSIESFQALKRFVEKRVEVGDDVITKIDRYIEKSKSSSSKNSYPKSKELKESKAKASENIQAIP